MDEDVRLEKPNVCRVTTVVAGKEFICLKPVHDDPPRRGHGQRSEQPTLYGYYPKSRRHYFARRYPNSTH